MGGELKGSTWGLKAPRWGCARGSRPSQPRCAATNEPLGRAPAEGLPEPPLARRQGVPALPVRGAGGISRLRGEIFLGICIPVVKSLFPAFPPSAAGMGGGQTGEGRCPARRPGRWGAARRAPVLSPGTSVRSLPGPRQSLPLKPCPLCRVDHDNTLLAKCRECRGVREAKRHSLQAWHIWRPRRDSPRPGPGPTSVPGMTGVPGGSVIEEHWGGSATTCGLEAQTQCIS